MDWPPSDSSNQMMLSRYCKIYPDRKDPDSVVLLSTRQASIATVPRALLEDIKNNTLNEDDRTTLADLGLLAESHEDETLEMAGLWDELNSMNYVFKSYVAMNLDCNLACKYCFEGLRKGKFYMSRETADAFVGFVEKKVSANKTLNEIHIVYYGGEPLLSTELILHMSGGLKALAKSLGIEYSASIITNGTLLTQKTAEKLRTVGIMDASVTLDGPKKIHDSYRPLKSGRGSFDRIVRNLKEVCDMLDVQIGGNYTQDNYRQFPLLLDYLIKEGLGPDRIADARFDFVTNESEGYGPPDFHDGTFSINDPWLFDAVLYLRGEISKRGYKRVNLAPWSCMMELRDRMVVNYNGDIYKCPSLIGREEFKVGNILSGVKDYSKSHNLNNWKNEKCLDCVYLPLCFGGCRYMKLVRDGNMEGVDCKKPYLDAVLEKLVLQDIKYAAQMKI